MLNKMTSTKPLNLRFLYFLINLGPNILRNYHNLVHFGWFCNYSACFGWFRSNLCGFLGGFALIGVVLARFVF